jgi:adenylate cyclase
MDALRRHGARIAITLLPVILALVSVFHAGSRSLVDSLDQLIYDARLRATMPGGLDPRIVIVDIDDPSLQQLGQWPWSRDLLARLTTELMERQQAAVLGFDVLFVEPDASSGLEALRRLAQGPLQGQPGLAQQIEQLAPGLDHDAAFARSLEGRPAVLGFYLTQTRTPRDKGQLPVPVLPAGALLPEGRDFGPRWNGFVGSIPELARAAPTAGFVNVVYAEGGSQDGVVRSVPLLARYDGAAATPGYYESLALAVYRLSVGSTGLVPVLTSADPASTLEALLLKTTAGPKRIPVDASASVLVPYRGPGGPGGGSFRYLSAADVVHGLLAPGELKGRVVLVGSTAPGLQDLRATPAGSAFPGVEVHANIVSGLLDGRLAAVPDYAPGYELATVLAAGLVLAFGLSLCRAPSAALLALSTAVALVALNTWLYLGAGLVLPLAAALLTVGLAFALNMSWGYFVEARAKRSLARLFGTYVPPELVEEMQADPGHYSMRARNKELTVMFCDMRGFTQMAERMAPELLQAFLNRFFSRLTEIISAHRGTVDKYMGDCVMAFWGAPLDEPAHAHLAVLAACEMVEAVRLLNEDQRQAGQPQIGVGIGINTGLMSVGDMGSAVRRSYTVVGDAVNLASRLEGVGPNYGVQIVASASTQQSAPGFVWQELDDVRVQGKDQVVRIYTPVARESQATPALRAEQARWVGVLSAYRAQDWEKCHDRISPFLSTDEKKVLYQLYAQRLASKSSLPKDPQWDGATRFEKSK